MASNSLFLLPGAMEASQTPPGSGAPSKNKKKNRKRKKRKKKENMVGDAASTPGQVLSPSAPTFAAATPSPAPPKKKRKRDATSETSVAARAEAAEAVPPLLPPPPATAVPPPPSASPYAAMAFVPPPATAADPSQKPPQLVVYRQGTADPTTATPETGAHASEGGRGENVRKRPDPTDDDGSSGEGGGGGLPQCAQVDSVAEESTTAPPAPLPVHDPRGRRWIDAVASCRRNHLYGASFDFDRYKQMDGGAYDWIKTRPYGLWASDNPVAIAVDCEMVETTNPETGQVDGRALCRLSVVDASDPSHPGGGEVVLDTLVKPDWPVTDCRTKIHGIKPSDLEGVQFTLSHAQDFMMALCSEETVVVGHSVHNDLAALRMEHHCVADTSFLFPLKDQAGRTPGLKDVYRSLTGGDMPRTHCSVNDSRVSLLCLNRYIDAGGKVEPVKRVPRSGGGDRGGHLPSKGKFSEHLLVHQILRGNEPTDVRDMFLNETSIQPADVPAIDFESADGTMGTCLVRFTSADHSRLAFNFLSSEMRRDERGFLQKRVEIGSTYCFVSNTKPQKQ